MSKPTLYLDNSSLELITTCPTKARNKLILRRVRNIETPATRFGSHIHAALAYRYRAEALGQKWSQDAQCEVLTKLFMDTPCESESWRNLNMAQTVIRHYNEEYPCEAFEIIKLKDGTPLVELPFALVMGEVAGRQLVYTGRIDLGIRKPGQGLFVLDFKTTSMLGNSFWEDVAVMEAQRGYCYALRECYGEEPTGYIVRALATRAPTKTGTSIEFKEETTFTKVPSGQLDEWRDNMLEQATEWCWYVDRNVFPYHHKHCVAKYGTCEFYHTCVLPKASREAALMSGDYKENEWNPLQ